MWDIDPLFQSELRTAFTTAFRIDVLDTDFNVVGFLESSVAPVVDTTDFVTDGNVDVDVERGTRRTSELTLINPSAYYTPTIVDGDWDGLIYTNRVLRLHRGIHARSVDSPYLAPIGTFLVDKPEVISERNMSMVVLTLSDMWKKLTKSHWATPTTYTAGTLYNDIISDIVTESGADYPLSPDIDPLDDRTTENKTLTADLVFEEGDSRGDKLFELSKTWGIDMYFDPEGRFITKDVLLAPASAPVWEFYASPDADGMLLSVRRSFTDDNLYNHIVVIGGDFCNFIRQERVDNDPDSLTNVDRLGDRVLTIKDEKLDTSLKVSSALATAWNKRLLLDEEMSSDVICNPALEGNDLIRVTDTEQAKVDEVYRLKRFNIPIITSRQSIQAVNVVNLDACFTPITGSLPYMGYGTFTADFGPTTGPDQTIFWAGYVTGAGTVTFEWDDPDALLYHGTPSEYPLSSFAFVRWDQLFTTGWEDRFALPSTQLSNTIGTGGTNLSQGKPWYEPDIGWMAPDYLAGTDSIGVTDGYWLICTVGADLLDGSNPGPNGLQLTFTISGTAELC